MARAAPTADTGERVAFDDVWGRRVTIPYDERLTIAIPTIEDLVRTKRWGLRQKDIADIQLLQALLDSTRAKP